MGPDLRDFLIVYKIFAVQIPIFVVGSTCAGTVMSTKQHLTYPRGTSLPYVLVLDLPSVTWTWRVYIPCQLWSRRAT